MKGYPLIKHMVLDYSKVAIKLTSHAIAFVNWPPICHTFVYHQAKMSQYNYATWKKTVNYIMYIHVIYNPY